MKIYFVGNDELYESKLYQKSTIEECQKWLSELDVVGLDTETEGMFNHKNKIVMLQLYDQKSDIAYVIDVRTISISSLKESLESILVIGQNLKFDYKFLKFHGINLNSIYDTLLAECILTTGLQDRKLGLAGLSEKYCNKTLDKSVRNQFVGLKGEPFTETQIVYGVGDVEVLFKIRDKQLTELSKLNLHEVLTLENDVCLVLADIEYNGMLFDPKSWLELSKSAKGNTVELEKTLDKLVESEEKLKSFVIKPQGNLFAEVEEGYSHDRNINIKWSSPTQIVKVFNKLGFKLDSVGANEIKKFENKSELIKNYSNYQKQRKLTTTYGQDFLKYINKNTQRIHTNFWQILETGRISSGDSNKDNFAPNMQNLPADNRYRNCFIAPKGYKIVSCDFSGQELRILAHVSKEPVWLEAFRQGRDLHSEVASMVFNVEIDKVKDKPEFLKGKSYRDVAKTINFGLAYGMSEFKLSKTLDISVEIAKDMIDKYFSNLGELNKFLSQAARFGTKQGFIRTCKPFGRIRWFKENGGSIDDFKRFGEVERGAKNTVIQGTGADMTKLALIYISNYIKINKLQDKVKIVMTVHDQIDCEVEESYAQEWSIIQRDLMIKAGEVIIKDIPVLADISINDKWSK